MALKRLCSIVFISAQLAAGLAWADCSIPKAPGAVPDGSSASIDEMNAAKSALDKYQSAVKEYLSCVDNETKGRITELGSNVDGIRQVKLMAEKRSSVIQEELQKQADSYTEQMRAWKLTNRQ